MTDIESIYIDNFRESLRQIQRYSVFGIFSSLSLLLLQLSQVQGELAEPVSVPGLAVGVEPNIAKVLLAVFHVVAGYMAILTTYNAFKNKVSIANVSLEALAKYPSLATSEEPIPRRLAGLLPAFFFTVAIFSWLYPPEFAYDWVMFISALIIGVPPYLVLFYFLRDPIAP